MARETHPRGHQDGFTIIELMISLALISIMFLGLGAALMGSMAGTADSRRNQQAADLMAEIAEGVRSADYASVAVKTPGAGDPALTSDPAITLAGALYSADVNGDASGGQEPLLVDPAGTVIAQQQLDRDGAHYSVFNYVTIPAGATNYKRLTTVIQWVQAGTVHTRRTMTSIAETQRGLPLPDFVFKSAMTGLPGGDAPTFDNSSPLNLFVSLTNRGARDAWTITATGKSWAWEYNQATGPDTSNLTPLVSATTPLINTDDSMFVNIHVASLPASGGGPFPITIRATSVAQPTVYKEVTFQVSIVTDCSGCTYVPLFLHNTPTSAGCIASPCSATEPNPDSTRVVTDLYADLVAPKWTGTQPDFDTDVTPTGPGRWLLPGGSIATEPLTSGKVMQWRWDAGSTLLELVPAKKIKLTVCIKNPLALATPKITWQVLAQKQSGAAVAVTTAVTQSVSGASATGFVCTTNTNPVLSPPSGTTWPLKGTGSNYRKLFLRIVNPGATTPSLESYELGYDTVAIAPSMELPTP